MTRKCAGSAIILLLLTAGSLFYFVKPVVVPRWKGVIYDYWKPFVLWGVFFWANAFGWILVFVRSGLFRTTGRKLQHLDDELHTGHAVSQELAERLRAG